MRFAAVIALAATLLCGTPLCPPGFAQDQGEITFWNSVKDSKNASELNAYIDAYPQGKFAPLARLRIKELGGAASETSTGSAPAASGGPTISDAPPQPAARLDWKEFQSAEGNFTVLLPGEPKLEKKENGAHFTVDLGGSVYMVTYSDSKPGSLAPINAAVLLDRSQAALLKAVDGKLRKNRSKTIAGYPGREVVFDTPDKNAGKVRIFFVKDRLYQIWFYGTQGEETRPEIRTFLDSFKLIKDVGPHTPPPVSVPVGSDWREFRSAEGQFAILLPGKPEVSATKADAKGRSEHRFSVDLGDTAYMVSYDTYRPGLIANTESKKILDTAQDALLSEMKGTLRQHRAMNVAGNAGREVVFDTPNKTTGIVRIYPARDRLYQIWYVGPAGQEARTEVEKYLDSFTFLN